MAEPRMFTRAPTAPPQFTIKTLRNAIPPHCFERSMVRSFSYLITDLVLAACLFYSTRFFDHPALPVQAKYVLWPLYWFWQGVVCTGIWVIAHECGHGAFSAHTWVNDLVGLTCHSALLVPYYSWKHSHRRHHSNTGSLAKDEVFVPSKREEALEEDSQIYNNGLLRLGYILFVLTAGWPLYLMFNISGRPYDRWANHYDPYSPIYSKRERVEVAISDVGVAVVAVGLIALAKSFGWAWLVCVYVIPYLFVNAWLVMITLLQHTHPSLPHYDDKEWDWLRGALATVDRNYGILNHFHHHIADTHVAHHLFSYMPHYHAQEATDAIRKVVGDYYQRDDRNIWVALWQDFGRCNYVAPDEKGAGIAWYRK